MALRKSARRTKRLQLFQQEIFRPLVSPNPRKVSQNLTSHGFIISQTSVLPFFFYKSDTAWKGRWFLLMTAAISYTDFDVCKKDMKKVAWEMLWCIILSILCSNIKSFGATFFGCSGYITDVTVVFSKFTVSGNFQKLCRNFQKFQGLLKFRKLPETLDGNFR